MPTFDQLSEMGKELYNVNQKAQEAQKVYKENEIGEQRLVRFNEYKWARPTIKHDDRGEMVMYPPRNIYAEVIAKAFDKMVEDTIPKEAFLSMQFENFITSERNNLLDNSKIKNANAYFKTKTDFETGEIITQNAQGINESLESFINSKIATCKKAFTTFMQNNPEKAFASQETLEKWQEYYTKKAEEVKQRLEQGNFDAYNKINKEGEIIQVGTQEDALKHQSNINGLLEKVENAKEIAKEANEAFGNEASTQNDYVGNKSFKMNQSHK